MASFDYAIEQAIFDLSIGVRRRSWPPGDFVKIFYVTPPAPPTMEYGGLALEIYTPSAADQAASDWERA